MKWNGMRLMSHEIYDKWKESSANNDCFGLPTKDEASIPNSRGYRYVNFEYGHITWNPANGPDSDPYGACTYTFSVNFVEAHTKRALQLSTFLEIQTMTRIMLHSQQDLTD